MFYYSFFDLILATLVPVPQLTSVKARKPDITIEFRSLEEIPSGVAQSPSYPIVDPWLFYRYFEASWWFEYEGLFSCKVTTDRLVVYHERQMESMDLWPYILGTGLSLCLQLRGYFPMHGSMMKWKDKGIMVTGHSGAGKSTTLAHFLTRGACLVSDDVTLLEPVDAGRVKVKPGLPWLKLSQDTLEKLGKDPSGFDDAVKGSRKKLVTWSESVCRTEVMLEVLVEILPTTEVSEVSIKRMKGIDAFQTLAQHVYRPLAVSALGVEKDHFAFCSELSARVRIYQITRPEGTWSMDEVIRKIEEII